MNPPGSTFKLVVTAAALESGRYTPESTFPNPATLTLPGTDAVVRNSGGGTCGSGAEVTLADALRRLIAARIQLDGASDHGVSEALYLRDPDENGVELYVDRPEPEWPRSADGSLAMVTRRLDLDSLLREPPID
jgi:hypothetical protein